MGPINYIGQGLWRYFSSLYIEWRQSWYSSTDVLRASDIVGIVMIVQEDKTRYKVEPLLKFKCCD